MRRYFSNRKAPRKESLTDISRIRCGNVQLTALERFPELHRRQKGEMPVLMTAYCSASRRNNNFRRLTICQHGCRSWTRTSDLKVMSLASCHCSILPKVCRTAPANEVKDVEMCRTKERKFRNRRHGRNSVSPGLFAWFL